MSIAVSLVEILKANGNTPVAPADMKDKINFPTKSIHNSCLAMVKQGIFEKLDDGRFKLVEGISEEKLKEVLKIPDPDLSNEGNNDEEGGGKGGKDGGVKKDLTSIKATAKTEFEDLLKSVGVDKNVVPTISKLFFDGDTDSLPWLREVLTRHASGFIAAKELRLVLAAYAKSHNLPATDD